MTSICAHTDKQSLVVCVILQKRNLQTKTNLFQLMKINCGSQPADMSEQHLEEVGKALQMATKFPIANPSNLIFLLGDWIKSPIFPIS